MPGDPIPKSLPPMPIAAKGLAMPAPPGPTPPPGMPSPAPRLAMLAKAEKGLLDESGSDLSFLTAGTNSARLEANKVMNLRQK